MFNDKKDQPAVKKLIEILRDNKTGAAKEEVERQVRILNLKKEIEVKRKGITQNERSLAYIEAHIQRRIAESRKAYGVKGDYLTASDVELTMMMFSDATTELTEGVLEEFNARFVFGYLDWMKDWKESGFAKLACSRNLASALMLTDVPNDVEVQSPWKAWSLIVPPNLIHLSISLTGIAEAKAALESGTVVEGTHIQIKAKPGDEVHEAPVVRVWCSGINIVGIVVKSISGRYITMKCDLDNQWLTDADPVTLLLLNYVRGALLSLESDVQRNRGMNWGVKSEGNHRTPGTTPGKGCSYVIGKNVTVDLSDEVKHLCSGKKGHGVSPKVQFLVRGHWRNQAHGEKRQQRRRQWIEPFWKGPEESRVLLRTHQIKKPGEV